jgi:glycosyltransferase involved in cell wall biosynthesis
VRIGLSLLSVYPSSNAGTTTYAHGLLAGLVEDEALELVALANAEMAEACGQFVSHGTIVRGSRRYAAMEQRFGRVPALAITALLPIVTAADIRNVDVIHYLQTVRSPCVERPTVVTLHDVQHLDLPHLFSASIRLWRRLMYDEAARKADAVITVSEHARARIIDRLGVDPSVVHVSHHGVDSALFTPGPAEHDAEVRESLGVDEPYMYYPASLAPHKNHRTLLQALRLLENRKLLLTGPHVGRLDGLLAEANACGVGDRVQHLGMVSVEQLPALYRGASCLVFPSLYEGFGVPIVEAMASGCPVTCADRGAPAEVADDAALTFDPTQPEAIAEAVRRLDDRCTRDRYVTAGLQRAAQFTWQNVARQHRKVYELAVR